MDSRSLGIIGIALLLLLGGVAPARADRGFYVTESIGGASYRGDLAAYGDGGVRVQLGLGFRHGPWTIELLGGGIANELFYVDCYGDECGRDPDAGSFFYYGADLRRSYPVLQSRYARLSVDLVLHAGPRYFVGDEALTGFHGPGANAGATLELRAWAIGYFLDVGVDAMWMHMPVDHVAGVSPHLMIGAKVGWL